MWAGRVNLRQHTSDPPPPCTPVRDLGFRLQVTVGDLHEDDKVPVIALSFMGRDEKCTPSPARSSDHPPERHFEHQQGSLRPPSARPEVPGSIQIRAFSFRGEPFRREDSLVFALVGVSWLTS